METGVRAERSKSAESEQPRVERSRGCYLLSANDIHWPSWNKSAAIGELAVAPSTVINAVDNVYRDRNCQLSIVGDATVELPGRTEARRLGSSLFEFASWSRQFRVELGATVGQIGSGLA